MVQKKPSPKALGASKLPTTTTTPLLTSSFSPAHLRLSLFASTILGLDSVRLRIHDTVTGRLRCEHAFDKGVSVNSLAWGTVPPSSSSSSAKKKRKRADGEDSAAAPAPPVVVAAATSRGEIVLFSPSEGVVVGVLEGGHLGEVRQFVFSGVKEEEGRGWSCGADGKLVEWDLRRRLTMRTINLPDAAIRRLAYSPPTHVLCASHTVYAITHQNPGISPPAKFTANTTLIHSLATSQDYTHFLSAADSDRFINVFALSGGKSVGALVAESDVVSVDVTPTSDILSAVTADGAVEVFTAPFDPAGTADAATGSPNATRKRKAITKKASAKVAIIRPGGKERVTIADASIQGEDIVVAWVESGVNMEFEKLRWASPETGALVLTGTVEIERSSTIRIGGGAAATGATMNGVKDMGKASVDQSKSVVVGGTDAQDIGMEDAVSDAGDSAPSDLSDDEDADAATPADEPSFFEKFQALEVTRASTALTVPTTTAAATTTKKAIAPPAAGSLTTVLTQALKTNDTQMLESCLHVTDSATILTTIRRLTSPLAVQLLERLAERIARRPGRAGSLGIWVRWTLVAHGGYLVSLPDLMSTLSGLYTTLHSRAGALPRLLALQGRLDMLKAQVDLRKALRSGVEEEEEEEERGVLYVEGQDDDDDDDAGSDEEPEEVGMQGLLIEDASFIGGKVGGEEDEEDMEEEEEEEDDDEEDDEDEEDEDEEDEDKGFFDIEASEASGDEDEDEDEVDYDDVDVQVLDSEEEEEEQQQQMSTKTKSKSKSRR